MNAETAEVAELVAKAMPRPVFEPVVISPIVHKYGGGLGVKVKLRPHDGDDEDPHNPREIDVYVAMDETPGMTLDAIRQKAKELAREQLQAALKLLE